MKKRVYRPVGSMAAGKKRQSHRTIFLDPSLISGDKWHRRQGKRMCRSNYESSGALFWGAQKSSDPFNCAASGGTLRASSVLQEFTLSLGSRVEFLTTEGISSLYGQLVPGISRRGSAFRSPPMRFNSPPRLPLRPPLYSWNLFFPACFPVLFILTRSDPLFLISTSKKHGSCVQRLREETRSRIERSAGGRGGGWMLRNYHWLSLGNR